MAATDIASRLAEEVQKQVATSKDGDASFGKAWRPSYLKEGADRKGGGRWLAKAHVERFKNNANNLHGRGQSTPTLNGRGNNNVKAASVTAITS